MDHRPCKKPKLEDVEADILMQLQVKVEGTDATLPPSSFDGFIEHRARGTTVKRQRSASPVQQRSTYGQGSRGTIRFPLPDERRQEALGYFDARERWVARETQRLAQMGLVVVPGSQVIMDDGLMLDWVPEAGPLAQNNRPLKNTTSIATLQALFDARIAKMEIPSSERLASILAAVKREPLGNRISVQEGNSITGPMSVPSRPASPQSTSVQVDQAKPPSTQPFMKIGPLHRAITPLVPSQLVDAVTHDANLLTQIFNASEDITAVSELAVNGTSAADLDMGIDDPQKADHIVNEDSSTVSSSLGIMLRANSAVPETPTGVFMDESDESNSSGHDNDIVEIEDPNLSGHQHLKLNGHEIESKPILPLDASSDSDDEALYALARKQKLTRHHGTAQILAEQGARKWASELGPSLIKQPDPASDHLEAKLLRFKRKKAAENILQLEAHSHYRARRLLLFPKVVACVSGRGDVQFLDRKKRDLLPLLRLPREYISNRVEDVAMISENIAVMAYTNVSQGSLYQASLIDLRDFGQKPRRIDLKDRPHVHTGDHTTKFGITAVCTVRPTRSWLQFVSGGCGGADKSLYLWSVRPRNRNPSKFTVRTTLLPTHHSHKSATTSLAYMDHKDCIISTGHDCWLRMVDLGAEKVTRCQVEGGAEIYQLHTMPAGNDTQGESLLLCEMKNSLRITVLDIRTTVKPVIQLGSQAVVVASEESLEEDTRTRYTRGCFTGQLFIRGKDIYDLRNAKQSIRTASDTAVHTLVDPKRSTVMQYGGSIVTYFDFKKSKPVE
ncbi:hypothetical protein FRB93_013379 [Tulasnella sp. JGI-2019a]|nr:hypothetical protein FRB93_013379 [Tulasnella sp. JGI-2019a]